MAPWGTSCWLTRQTACFFSFPVQPPLGMIALLLLEYKSQALINIANILRAQWGLYILRRWPHLKAHGSYHRPPHFNDSLPCRLSSGINQSWLTLASYTVLSQYTAWMQICSKITAWSINQPSTLIDRVEDSLTRCWRSISNLLSVNSFNSCRSPAVALLFHLTWPFIALHGPSEWVWKQKRGKRGRMFSGSKCAWSLTTKNYCHPLLK